MSLLRKLLRCVWCSHRLTDDDRLNAETENDLYDHRKALEAAQEASANRAEPNQKLHSVLDASRSRSQEFVLFEELIRKEADRARGHSQ